MEFHRFRVTWGPDLIQSVLEHLALDLFVLGSSRCCLVFLVLVPFLIEKISFIARYFVVRMQGVPLSYGHYGRGLVWSVGELGSLLRLAATIEQH